MPMKLHFGSCPPIVTLRWDEYKKRSIIERFPLSILVGMLIMTLSLNRLYDRSMEKKATSEPISVGLSVIEEILSEET